MTSRWIVTQVEDSFDYLRHMPNESVDVTLTDPPYSNRCQSNIQGGTRSNDWRNKIELKFAPLYNYTFARDMILASRRWALSFCTMEDLGKYELAVGEERFIKSGIWYKPNSIGQLTKDRPASAFEAIAMMHDDSTKIEWNGVGSYGIWKCNGTRGLPNRHPNQKPLNLALKLVALFSNRGETIFDPFCGSATFGVAALMLGRSYIGLDQDPYWVAESRKRLAGTKIDSVSETYALSLCSMKSEDDWIIQ